MVCQRSERLCLFVYMFLNLMWQRGLTIVVKCLGKTKPQAVGVTRNPTMRSKLRPIAKVATRRRRRRAMRKATPKTASDHL